MSLILADGTSIVIGTEAEIEIDHKIAIHCINGEIETRFVRFLPKLLVSEKGSLWLYKLRDGVYEAKVPETARSFVEAYSPSYHKIYPGESCEISNIVAFKVGSQYFLFKPY